jgi:hypothetical protein
MRALALAAETVAFIAFCAAVCGTVAALHFGF